MKITMRTEYSRSTKLKQEIKDSGSSTDTKISLSRRLFNHSSPARLYPPVESSCQPTSHTTADTPCPSGSATCAVCPAGPARRRRVQSFPSTDRHPDKPSAPHSQPQHSPQSVFDEEAWLHGREESRRGQKRRQRKGSMVEMTMKKKMAM